jgi:hypothetical protein
MGATITTGKAVMACQPTAQSEVIYILFEQTYEKNCYPHTPHWGCFAIGTYQQVMQRVYAHAAAAEGGSLSNRSMDLTPESYLRGWNLAFHKPMMFNNRDISFRILERNYWMDGIESTRAGNVCQKLKDISRLDIWEKLISNDDKVSLSFYDNIDLITSLFGVDGIEAPWRIIPRYVEPYGAVVPGFIPGKTHGGRFPAGMDRLIKLKSNYMYHTVFAKLGDDGYYHGNECEYRVIAEFVKKQAYECEMVQHGLGVKNIKSFRELLDALPFSNDDYDIFINKSDLNSYSHSSYANKLGCKLEDAPELYSVGNMTFDEAEKEFYSFSNAFVFIPKQQAKLAA